MNFFWQISYPTLPLVPADALNRITPGFVHFFVHPPLVPLVPSRLCGLAMIWRAQQGTGASPHVFTLSVTFSTWFLTILSLENVPAPWRGVQTAFVFLLGGSILSDLPFKVQPLLWLHFSLCNLSHRPGFSGSVLPRGNWPVWRESHILFFSWGCWPLSPAVYVLCVCAPACDFKNSSFL